MARGLWVIVTGVGLDVEVAGMILTFEELSVDMAVGRRERVNTNGHGAGFGARCGAKVVG